MRVCNYVSVVDVVVESVHDGVGNLLLVGGGSVHVVGCDSDCDVVVVVAAVVHGLCCVGDWDGMLGCCMLGGVRGIDVYFHKLRDILRMVVVLVRAGVSLKFKEDLDLLKERFIWRDSIRQTAGDDF